jgi:pimeloyl-ACP methyl ester carboxylesterase
MQVIKLIVLLAAVIVIIVALYDYTKQKVREAESEFPPNGEFIEVEGIKLHYVLRGEGQAVVCLHGGVLWANDFSRLMELGSENYQFYAFDRPGYGYSERPTDQKLTPVDQARLLHQALQKLGVEQPIIVGHSWSGLLTLAYALEYPEHISGMVLVGGAFYGGEAYAAGRADKVISFLVQAPVLGQAVSQTILVPFAKLMVGGMMKTTFAPDPVPDGYTETAKALFARPGQFRANREDVDAFRPTADLLAPQFSSIQTPTVIVVGEQDPFHPQEQSHRLHKELVHSELVVLPDSGHMLPQAHPEPLLDIIDTFHQRIKGTD